MIKFVAVLAALVLSAHCFAEEKCSDALVPDVEQLELDIDTRLTYLKTINKDNFTERKNKVSGSGAALIGGVPLSAMGSFNEFSQKRKVYFEQIGFTSEMNDASSYLVRKVPQEAFNSYRRCIDRKASTDGLHLIPEAISPLGATMQILWRPSPTGLQSAVVTISGNGFEADKSELRFDNYGRQSIFIKYSEDNGAHLTVSTEGYTDTFLFSERPKVTNICELEPKNTIVSLNQAIPPSKCDRKVSLKGSVKHKKTCNNADVRWEIVADENLIGFCTAKKFKNASLECNANVLLPKNTPLKVRFENKGSYCAAVTEPPQLLATF